MKDNTVVTASDRNYLWGVFLLIASMRRSGMDEPVLVFGDGYTAPDKELLMQFADVRIVDAPHSRRSMTCRKPEAMLLAETKYVTWADCDGFFTGNCSDFLYPPSEEKLHARLRSQAEMIASYRGFYKASETPGGIPAAMLDVWRKDVGERDVAAEQSCVSACVLSIARKRSDFLERWQRQMLQVLPDDNVGVVDNRSRAYFQTDEAVLNSLLCFMEKAPKISQFELNRRQDAMYIHFVSHPKPWVGWTKYAFQRYDDYLAVVEYVLQRKLELPAPLPYSLTPGNKELCRILQGAVWFRQKLKKLRSRFNLRKG